MTAKAPLTSDLAACYHELLEGVPIERLLEKYVRIEVLAAQELFAKDTTLEELKAFQERRARQLEARAGQALECVCGLMFFDMGEYGQHLNNLNFEDPVSLFASADREEHRLKVPRQHRRGKL